MGYISIQNAKIFVNIHLRWLICICIGKKRKKKHFSLIFSFKWRKTGKSVSRKCGGNINIRAVFSELKIRFLIPRSSKSLANMIFVLPLIKEFKFKVFLQ